MRFKRGRLPARHTMRTMRGALALAKALAPLGAPPAVSTDYVSAVISAVAALPTPPGAGGGPWGLYLNDQLGDCTIADSCHRVMLATANGGTMIAPTDAEALTAYEAVSGYQPGNSATDTGADETTVDDYMQSTGIAGIKSAGSGMLDPTNLDHIKWTVQIFGACRLGIICDQAMEDAFTSGQPWETAADPNDPTAGGHDVPIVCYDAQYAYVVTWGGGTWSRGLQPVAWSLVADSAFLEEAHPEVYPSFIKAGGTAPSGFDLSQLLAELPAVEAA